MSVTFFWGVLAVVTDNLFWPKFIFGPFWNRPSHWMVPSCRGSYFDSIGWLESFWRYFWGPKFSVTRSTGDIFFRFFTFWRHWVWKNALNWLLTWIFIFFNQKYFRPPWSVFHRDPHYTFGFLSWRRFQKSNPFFVDGPFWPKKCQNTSFFDLKWRFLDFLVVFSMAGIVFCEEKTPAVSLSQVWALRDRFFEVDFHKIPHYRAKTELLISKDYIFGIYASSCIGGRSEEISRRHF